MEQEEGQRSRGGKGRSTCQVSPLPAPPAVSHPLQNLPFPAASQRPRVSDPSRTQPPRLRELYRPLDAQHQASRVELHDGSAPTSRRSSARSTYTECDSDDACPDCSALLVLVVVVVVVIIIITALAISLVFSWMLFPHCYFLVVISLALSLAVISLAVISLLLFPWLLFPCCYFLGCYFLGVSFLAVISLLLLP